MKERQGYPCFVGFVPLILFLLLTLLWPCNVFGIAAGGNNNFVHNNDSRKGGSRFFNEEVIGSRERGRRYSRDRSSSSVNSETTVNALTQSKSFPSFNNNVGSGVDDDSYFSTQLGSFHRQQQQPPQVQHPQEVNPLLKKATEGSVGLLFLLLTWRSLSTYELAGEDSIISHIFSLFSFFKSILRTFIFIYLYFSYKFS